MAIKLKGTIRVLMVVAASQYKAREAQWKSRVPPWATRQFGSLAAHDIEVFSFCFSDRKSIRGILRCTREMRNAVDELQPDVVHVHYGALQALVATLLCPSPVVVSFCGSDLFGNYRRSGRMTVSGGLSCLMSQLSTLFADSVIAKTEELRKRLWFARRRRQCEVIPNGIDISRFSVGNQMEARTTLGWSHREPVVVFTDRPGSWVKNPLLARDAIDHARREYPGIRLVILESIPASLIPMYFNAADAFLLTSLHEGSNNAVKEAMACDLPVIATDCGDTRMRFRNVSASRVCEADPKVLGDAIRHVIGLRVRSNGSAEIQNLSLESVAPKIRTVYERVLSNHRDKSIVAKAACAVSIRREDALFGDRVNESGLK